MFENRIVTVTCSICNKTEKNTFRKIAELGWRVNQDPVICRDCDIKKAARGDDK